MTGQPIDRCGGVMEGCNPIHAPCLHHAQHSFTHSLPQVPGGGEDRICSKSTNERRQPELGSDVTTTSTAASSNGGTVGKLGYAAGSIKARPRLSQSFLTREDSEFGVVRPEAVKITQRFTILEKVRG